MCLDVFSCQKCFGLAMVFWWLGNLPLKGRREVCELSVFQVYLGVSHYHHPCLGLKKDAIYSTVIIQFESY